MRKYSHQLYCSKRAAVFILLCSIQFSIIGQQTSIKQVEDLFLHADSLAYPYPDSALSISLNIKAISNELRYDWGILQSELIDGIVYYQQNKLDSASIILNNFVDEAININESSYEEARARTYLGFIYRRLDDYEKAKNNFEKAAYIFQKIDNPLLYCANMVNIGIIFGMRADYPEALKYFLKAKEIALKHDSRSSKDRLSAIHANISVIYSEMGDFEQALIFSKKGLELSMELNDTISMGSIYNMIGETFSEVEQYDSALFYHNLSIALAPKNNSRYRQNMVYALQSKATIYEKKGDLNEAMKVLRESISYRSLGENYKLDGAYNLYSKFHEKLGNYDSALYFIRINLKQSFANGDKIGVRGSTKKLMNLFVKMNSYDSAYYYQSLSKIYSDSVYNETSNKKYNKLQIALATLEKEKEIAALEQQQVLEKANKKILIISIVSILVIAILVIASLIYRHKNKQKRLRLKQLELEAEIQQIEKELNQQALHMINMNNNFTNIEESIRKLKSNATISSRDLQKLLSGISVNKSLEKEWQQFESYFSKMHPTFGHQLLKQHENLTLQERRLISLIKMNLSNREISSILSIEPRSVIMSRYRLKKKLGLDDTQDLEVYVHTLAQEVGSN